MTVTHRDTWFPGVVCAGDLVELPDALGPVERVGLGAGLLVGGGGEHPAQMVVGLLGPLEDRLHGLRFRVARGNGINRRPSELRRRRRARARLGYRLTVTPMAWSRPLSLRKARHRDAQGHA